MNWFNAELDLVNLLNDNFDLGGARLARCIRMQYRDIDVLDGKHQSYSVKAQYSVDRYKTLLFEHTLKDTFTGDTMEGSFVSCEAKYYAIRFDSNNASWMMLMDTEQLKEYIGKGEWKQQHTRASTNFSNKSERRKYNSTVCHVLPVEELYNQEWTTMFILKDKKWKLHNKVTK